MTWERFLLTARYGPGTKTGRARRTEKQIVAERRSDNGGKTEKAKTFEDRVKKTANFKKAEKRRNGRKRRETRRDIEPK